MHAKDLPTSWGLDLVYIGLGSPFRFMAIVLRLIMQTGSSRHVPPVRQGNHHTIFEVQTVFCLRIQESVLLSEW